MHYWVILNSNKFIARRTSWSNLFPYLAVLRQCMNLLLIASCQDPVNVAFSCTQPLLSVILQGRLRKLVVSWSLFPDLFPNQSRKESTTSSEDLIRAFKGLPEDLKMRIHVTSRLHYDGRFSISRSEYF